MKLLRNIVCALATAMCTANCIAQIVVSTPVPDRISIGSLDPVISKARLDASKAGDPALEFEEVRLHIKNTTDKLRFNNSQEVEFDNPDALRSWIRDAARRTDRSKEELLQEIVDAVSPNPCPSLTGANPSSSNYLRDQATRNLQKARATAGAPNTESGTADSDSKEDPEPEPAQPTAQLRAPAVTPRGPAGDPAAIKVDFVDTPTTKTVRKVPVRK